MALSLGDSIQGRLRFQTQPNCSDGALVSGDAWILPSLPGPGIVRLIPGLAALCVLCWPNLAYHLTNLLIWWPETEGRVTSFTSSESYPVLGYSFEFRGNTYGGRTAVKSKALSYSEGQTVTIAYDPFNPDESKVSF